MPGTILVSVLEFMDLPSSSPSSSILVKVSMGKREYQTWDKGDFSFPLTTLRDNLVVFLQDAEGNEISEAGIETKSIVEKGVWDDFFPLKPGGNVHMKLQFVLNEEERNKIRMLRESALKKKQREFFRTPSSLQVTPSAGTDIVSLCLPHEISDRNQETPSGTTLHQRVGLFRSESYDGNLVEMTEAQPLPPDVPSRAISADESSTGLRSSQSLPNLQEVRPRNLKNQGPLKKTSSRIKRMISAFESGSSEDMKSYIKPPPKRVQPSKIIAGVFPKTQYLKEHEKAKTETALSISKEVVNPFPSEDLQLDPTCNEKSREQINLLGDSCGTESSNDTEVKNGISNKLLHLHQEVDIMKENFPEDFDRTSATFGAVQASEKSISKHRHQPSKMLYGKRNSSGNPVIEESRIEISSANTSDVIRIQEVSTSTNLRTSTSEDGTIEGDSGPNVCRSVANCEDRHIGGDSGPHVSRSVANWEDRHIPFESSGVWIFPDEELRFCMTTSNKKVRNFSRGCSLKPNIHHGRVDLSTPENVEEHKPDGGAGVEVSTNEKNQRRPSKSTVENSDVAGTFGGPVAQAIKVAVMIGFGILVLLTRQRRNT